MCANRKDRKIKLQEASCLLQKDSDGIIPTAQMLEKETGIKARTIQNNTKEGEIWQKVTERNKQIITKLKKLNPKIKQKDLARELQLTTRQIRNLEKLK